MGWQVSIVQIREAHLQAVFAERSGDWHLVVRDYLVCLEAAERAGDGRAVRFFAAKLVTAYEAIGLPEKAHIYGDIAAVKFLR